MRLPYNPILIFALFLFLSSSKLPVDCKLKVVSHGISVYTCKRSDSDLNSVRATFNMKIPPAQYVDILLDIEHYPDWNKELRNIEVVKRFSPEELIYYFEIDAPWPVKDRYGVLHVRVMTHPTTGALTITQNLVPELMNKKGELLGIKEFNSVLNIIPTNKGRNDAEFNLIIDPGSNIPSWLINLVTVRMPVSTYTSIFKRAVELNDQPAKQAYND